MAVSFQVMMIIITVQMFTYVSMCPVNTWSCLSCCCFDNNFQFQTHTEFALSSGWSVFFLKKGNRLKFYLRLDRRSTQELLLFALKSRISIIHVFNVLFFFEFFCSFFFDSFRSFHTFRAFLVCLFFCCITLPYYGSSAVAPCFAQFRFFGQRKLGVIRSCFLCCLHFLSCLCGFVLILLCDGPVLGVTGEFHTSFRFFVHFAIFDASRVQCVRAIFAFFFSFFDACFRLVRELCVLLRHYCSCLLFSLGNC